jgi:TonB family protein
MARGMDLLKGQPPRSFEESMRNRRRMVNTGAERDIPVKLYIDSFRAKIERNGGLNYSQMSTRDVRADLLVSVTLRADGSVEDVNILRSSGSSALDENVRRIVRLNARYAAFPPNVAERYDVIEIRRVWSFGETLRLLEDLR